MTESKTNKVLDTEVHFVKGSDEVWRYADSGIAGPGARDLTLSERFETKTVVGADGETVERVIVSGDDIRSAPELLGWCLENGARVENSYGKVVEVLIPYEVWQERDQVPGAIYAPENSPREAERELARAERAYREAEQGIEIATAARADALRRYADEMTRQEAREITGLSIGRIQQLIRGYRLNATQQAVLQLVGSGAGRTLASLRQRAVNRKFPASDDFLQRRLRELEAQGLIELVGKKFRATGEGREALAAARAETEGSE
jgi:hypothetical protein